MPNNTQHNGDTPKVMPDGKGGYRPCPELMTEEELVLFLRIPEISQAKNYHNVIEHLKRTKGLPRMPLCKKVLYPISAVLDWIESQTGK